MEILLSGWYGIREWLEKVFKIWVLRRNSNHQKMYVTFFPQFKLVNSADSDRDF